MTDLGPAHLLCSRFAQSSFCGPWPHAVSIMSNSVFPGIQQKANCVQMSPRRRTGSVISVSSFLQRCGQSAVNHHAAVPCKHSSCRQFLEKFIGLQLGTSQELWVGQTGVHQIKRVRYINTTRYLVREQDLLQLWNFVCSDMLSSSPPCRPDPGRRTRVPCGSYFYKFATLSP